jgi:hypothetical protein
VTASNLPPILSARGRLFFSIGGGVPDYRFAGAAKLDSIAMARSVTRVRKDAVVGDPTLAWSGSLTMRASQVARHAMLSGQPIDILVLFGGACTAPDEVMYDTAIVIEDAVVTGGQSGQVTTLSASESGVVDFTMPFVASGAYMVSYPQYIEIAASPYGCVVALAEGINAFGQQRFYGLCAQRLYVQDEGYKHSLTLVWSDDLLRGGSWQKVDIGLFTIETGPVGGILPYSLKAVGDKLYATVHDQVITMPAPPSYGIVRNTGFAAIAPEGDVARKSLPLITLPNGSLAAPHLGGEVWTIDKSGVEVICPSTRTAPSGGGAFPSLGGDSILFTGATDVYEQHIATGRQRVLTQPPYVSVSNMMAISERDILAFSTGASVGVHVSRDGGASWATLAAESCFIDACRVGRSILYAASGAEDGIGSELMVSVDGGRNWRRIYKPESEHTDIACMLPLASGHVMLGGQVAPESGYDRCSFGRISIVPGTSGRIYLSASVEQAIVGAPSM